MVNQQLTADISESKSHVWMGADLTHQQARALQRLQGQKAMDVLEWMGGENTKWDDIVLSEPISDEKIFLLIGATTKAEYHRLGQMSNKEVQEYYRLN